MQKATEQEPGVQVMRASQPSSPALAALAGEERCWHKLRAIGGEMPQLGLAAGAWHAADLGIMPVTCCALAAHHKQVPCGPLWRCARCSRACPLPVQPSLQNPNPQNPSAPTPALAAPRSSSRCPTSKTTTPTPLIARTRSTALYCPSTWDRRR